MPFRILLPLCLMLCLALPALAQAPIIIKFSHVAAADAPKGKGAEYFKKLAEERTGGRVKVELFPNSLLYKDKEEIEALQLGSVQMLAPATSKFAPLGAKEFEVFDLPFLFDNVDEVHRVTQSAIGTGLLKKLGNYGLNGLAYWDNGFRQMTSNKPLRKAEDFRGVKIRIQSSKVVASQFSAIGALPQVLSFSEVYQAMQTGLVDGSETTLSNIYTQKYYEVQKSLTISNHSYLIYVVVANKKFWDGLPGDVRTILEGCIRDTTKYVNDITQKEDDDALQAIRKTGKVQIITLTPAERGEWKKVMIKTHHEMESRVGADLLRAIYKETNFKAE